MRHYEIICMIHPDKNEGINDIFNHLNDIIKNAQGKIHRIENWGRLQLSYPIKKKQKAHYILFNIEIPKNLIYEIKKYFQLNKIIIRNMIIKVKHAKKHSSSMMINKENQ